MPDGIYPSWKVLNIEHKFQYIYGYSSPDGFYPSARKRESFTRSAYLMVLSIDKITLNALHT